jgi:hypothetical protein
MEPLPIDELSQQGDAIVKYWGGEIEYTEDAIAA